LYLSRETPAFFTCLLPIRGYEGVSQGVHYSEVNMCLDGGLGEVIAATKNTFLFTNATEKLAAYPHKNGVDY
jgi:phosphopentomutase